MMDTFSPDQTAADVLLISGFLGSGKTTLLKRILGWHSDLSDTVVLVNEFGKVGIDGVLLKDGGSDVVELSGGCICCTLRIDLRRSLLRIWDRFAPRRIIIEASGVADPRGVLSVLEDLPFSGSMRLDKVVTVMDADLWEHRDEFGPVLIHQLETADLILLNKIDVVDSADVPRFLAQFHEAFPGTRVLPTIACDIDPTVLWTPSFREKARPAHMDRSHGHPEDGHGHPEDSHGHLEEAGFVTFTFHDEGVLDETRFNGFLASLPLEVFRIKGPVRFARGSFMVNHVGGRTEIHPWTDGDGTLLAVIGWHIEAGPYLEKLRGCVTAPRPVTETPPR